MRFAYEVLGSDGRIERGTLEASSEAEARRQLQRQAVHSPGREVQRLVSVIFLRVARPVQQNDERRGRGHCLDACPVFLNPQQLGKLAAAGRYDEMAAVYHLNDCMLCGCCSYVCPSNIPLSQQFAASKVALRQRKSAA